MKNFASKKIYSTCFAARLTGAQRDELVAALDDGLAYYEAAVMIRGWMKANAEAGLRRARSGRENITLSRTTPISKWYKSVLAARRYDRAQVAALAAQLHGTANDDARSKRALGQARSLAIVEGLRPTDIAAFERTELARDKLELERERMAFHQRRDVALDRARVLLERADAGEKSANLQHMINLALEEIQKMKHGEAP